VEIYLVVKVRVEVEENLVCLVVGPQSVRKGEGVAAGPPGVGDILSPEACMSFKLR
jgi:hypothetical protein